VSATLANGRARLSAGSFNWDADLPPSSRSDGRGRPRSFLRTARRCPPCCGSAARRHTLAPQFGVEIDDVTAAASSVSDLRGLIGIHGAAPDLTELKLDIKLSSRSPRDRVDAMLGAWTERCPIYLALLNPNRIDLTTAVK
jgi:hypothetical protein